MCYSENKNLPLLIPKFAREEKPKKKQDKKNKKIKGTKNTQSE